MLKQQQSVEQALQDINMVKNEILSRAWDEEFKKRYDNHQFLPDLFTPTCHSCVDTRE